MTSTRLAPVIVKPTRSNKPIDLHRKFRHIILSDSRENESIASPLKIVKKMSIFQSVCRVAPTKIFVYICKFVINWQKSKCKAFRRARCGSTYIRRPFGKQTWRLHNSGIYRILTHFCLEKTSTNGSTNWKVIRIGIWWFLQTTRRGSWSWRNIFCVEGTVFFLVLSYVSINWRVRARGMLVYSNKKHIFLWRE